MTLRKLKAKIDELVLIHGEDCRLLADHEPVTNIYHMAQGEGCAEYINVSTN